MSVITKFVGAFIACIGVPCMFMGLVLMWVGDRVWQWGE